jgi:hypothetical protein
VLSGGGLAISAWLCSVSPLAFAIGVYLPLATMAAIFVGGCMRAISQRRVPDAARAANEGPDTGILAASGLVAGEGLAGVLVAGLVAAQVVPRSISPRVEGVFGDLLVLAMLATVCVFLVRAGRASHR